MTSGPKTLPQAPPAVRVEPRAPTGELGLPEDAAGPDAPDGIQVFGVLEALLVRWRIVVAIPFVVVALATATALWLPPSYTAVTQFAPESTGQPGLTGGLAGIAGQFGISLDGAGSRSAPFYAQVAESRDILMRVLLARYPDARTPGVLTDSATLLEQYDVEGDSAFRVEAGLARLRDVIDVAVDLPTSIVTISVTDGSPEIAALVANRLVGAIDDFNTESRQSQARRRHEFVVERTAEAAAALRRAEQALDEFQDRNRAWQQSPQLTSMQARLRRAVDLRQEVFVTLSREVETSRIEQVNDAPVISVIERAAAPRFKSGPRRTVIVVLGAVFGVLLALSWVGAIELWRYLGRVDPPGYRRLMRRVQGRAAG